MIGKQVKAFFDTVRGTDTAAAVGRISATRSNFWWNGLDKEVADTADLLKAMGKDALKPLQGAWEGAKAMPKRIGKFDLFVEEYAKNGHGSIHQDFSGRDLSGMSDFGKDKPVIIANGNFEGADLSGASLTKVRFSMCHFKDANLAGVDFMRSDQSKEIGDCSFENADLTGAKFFGKTLYDVSMDDAILDGTDFRRADLRNARGLTLEQLKTAMVDRHTQLPKNVIAEIKAARAGMPDWTEKLDIA